MLFLASLCDFVCADGATCIESYQECDLVTDCPGGDDEGTANNCREYKVYIYYMYNIYVAHDLFTGYRDHPGIANVNNMMSKLHRSAFLLYTCYGA